MISKTMVDTGFPSRTARIMEAACNYLDCGQAHKANELLRDASYRIRQEIKDAKCRDQRFRKAKGFE